MVVLIELPLCSSVTMGLGKFGVVQAVLRFPIADVMIIKIAIVSSFPLYRSCDEQNKNITKMAWT